MAGFPISMTLVCSGCNPSEQRTLQYGDVLKLKALNWRRWKLEWLQTPAAKFSIEQYLAPEMAPQSPARKDRNKTVPAARARLHFHPLPPRRPLYSAHRAARPAAAASAPQAISSRLCKARGGPGCQGRGSAFPVCPSGWALTGRPAVPPSRNHCVCARLALPLKVPSSGAAGTGSSFPVPASPGAPALHSSGAFTAHERPLVLLNPASSGPAGPAPHHRLASREALPHRPWLPCPVLPAGRLAWAPHCEQVP